MPQTPPLPEGLSTRLLESIDHSTGKCKHHPAVRLCELVTKQQTRKWVVRRKLCHKCGARPKTGKHHRPGVAIKGGGRGSFADAAAAKAGIKKKDDTAEARRRSTTTRSVPRAREIERSRSTRAVSRERPRSRSMRAVSRERPRSRSTRAVSRERPRSRSARVGSRERSRSRSAADRWATAAEDRKDEERDNAKRRDGRKEVKKKDERRRIRLPSSRALIVAAQDANQREKRKEDTYDGLQTRENGGALVVYGEENDNREELRGPPAFIYFFERLYKE